ncbi:MAG TPA: WD40 repeat domain-containing protein [Caldimonas sp.]|nr:WD40 repeat domain-containing protein [Caldimonas sp.]HEX2542871.1 WD40 repeat domain-containing protein [Caldimonas sp.]
MLSDFGSHCLVAAFIGERPAFALIDGTVRRIGVDAACVRVHAAPSLAAAAVPGEDALLTSGEDGRVCRTEASGESREIGCVPRKWVTSVVQSRGRVAYASGKSVWLQSTDGARQLQHRRAVKGMAFTDDGVRLAVAQQDGVTVHDTGAAGEPLELASNDIHHASTFSPDGRFLVVASQNSFLHGWRLADRKHFRMLGYAAKVDGWAWSSDGALLATAGAAAAIVWPFDGADGPMNRDAIEVAPRAQSQVTAVAWRPQAATLAIGYRDGAVQVAGVTDASPPRLLRPGGRAPITSVAWNAAGDSVAFGSAAGECGAVAAGA